MKQTKISDFKTKNVSLKDSLVIYKNKSIFHKIYYFIISNNLIYKYRVSLKYGFTSFSAYIIDILLLIILTELLNVFYLLSVVIAHSISLAYSLFINFRFTFKFVPINKIHLYKSILKYLSISIFGLFLTVLFIGMLVEYLNINYIISKILVSLFLFFFLYQIHSFILKFKKQY